MEKEKKVYRKPYRCVRSLAQHVLAVAVPGAVGDWAVYLDDVPGVRHEFEAYEVARNGYKQGKALACLLFPQFDPDLYRE